MKNVIKTTSVIFLFFVLVIACKREDIDATANAADLAQIAALEYSLDSLNRHPTSAAPASASGINALTMPDLEELYKYFKSGAEAVKKIREIAAIYTRLFGHNWVVISYSDGYCIFNRVRSSRTINDIINTAIGKGGDCDWWPYPEGSRHVCLRNRTDAQALLKKHGKIIAIKWIDHPTKNCGK